jgi:predicted metal-dependent hydrolase
MNSWRDKEEFKTRVVEWAAKLDVTVRGLYVRPMRNKWASGSTAGTLSFNDELLGMERDFGDYVIVHELLHFFVPNHGKLWKSLMRAHLGAYEHIEARIKQAAPNRVAREVALPSPNTTEHAAPHSVVQVGW